MTRIIGKALARLSFATLAFATPGVASQAAVPAYRITDTIPAAGAGWDYANVDASTGQLFVARTDGVSVVPIGTNGGHPAHWGPIAKGHAVVPLPARHLLAVTSGKDDRLVFFDLTSGRQTGAVAIGRGPDAAIASPDGTVLVMNAEGGTVSVVDVARQTVVRSITLSPGLEFAALDKRGTLFVNNEDRSILHVAEPRTGRVDRDIALTGCEGPSGLGYDARTDLLISACANGKAAIVDAKSRRLKSLINIGPGPDAVLIDARRRLAFIPCGRDGTLVVIDLDHADGPAVAEVVPTEKGARTGSVDSRTGTIYLPTARFAPSAVPGQRPSILPGSFHILVLRPAPGIMIGSSM